MQHTIYLTTDCNFNCTYCYENYSLKMELDDFQLIKNIDFIFNIDKQESVGIVFMGGEPLIKKNLIIKAVNYIKKQYLERNVKYYLTTNCSLISDSFIDFMRDNNFSLRASFDGIEEAQTLNRKNKNQDSYYHHIFSNIILLKEKGIPLTIRMTVTDNTIGLMYENIVFLHENNLNDICMDMDINMKFTRSLLLEFEDQINKISDYYINEFKNRNKISIDQFDGKFLNVLCDFGNHFTMCDAGISNFKYMPDGNIYPCGFVTNNEKFIIGNIENNVDIEKAKLLAYSLFKKEPNKCTNCDIKNFCFGMKCGYMNYSCTNNINIPSDLTCQYEKTYYPVVVKILKHIANDKQLIDEILRPYFLFIKLDSLKLSELGKEISALIEY